MTPDVLDPNDVFVPAGMDRPEAFVIESRELPKVRPVRIRGRIIPAGRHEAFKFTAAQFRELTDLMGRHKALVSQTKLDPDNLSKVGTRLQLVLSQLLLGTFPAAYPWGAAWVKSNSPSGEFIMPEVPTDLEHIIESLDNTLGRLEALVQEGYPYPPMKAGRRQKVSLVDFIVTTPPNSGAYSPFIALLWRHDRAVPPPEQIDALKDQVPHKVRNAASDILCEARGRQPARWGQAQELMFWKGAREAYQWWLARGADLVGICPEARLVFGSGSAFFLRILDYAKAGGFIPFGFICPTSTAWVDFMGWLSRERGVSVPRRFFK